MSSSSSSESSLSSSSSSESSLSSQCKDVVNIIDSYSKSCQYKIIRVIDLYQSVRGLGLSGDVIQSCCVDPETGNLYIALKFSRQIVVYNCQGMFQHLMQIEIPNVEIRYFLQICTDGKKLAIRSNNDRLFIFTIDGRQLLCELPGINRLGGIAMYNGKLFVCCNLSICTFDMETDGDQNRPTLFGQMIGSFETQRKFYYIYIDQRNGDIYGFYGNIYVYDKRGFFQRILREYITSGGMAINAFGEIITCDPNGDDGDDFDGNEIRNEKLTIRKFDGSLVRTVSFTAGVNQMNSGGVSFCDGKFGQLIMCRGRLCFIIE